MHWIVGVLCWSALALTLIFALCRLLGLWTKTTSWLNSTREEKADLTKSDLYSANGFLIKSDLEEYGGDNYHRLDWGDSDFPMTAMTIFPLRRDSAIPPQPLRPAPLAIPRETKISNESINFNIPLSDACQNDSDKFYNNNINMVATESFIAPTIVKQTLDDSQNARQDIILGDYQNDFTTRNNLNIYKKPDYTSTNPFVSEEFDSKNELIDPHYTQNILSDESSGTTHSNEQAGKCDEKHVVNIHNSSDELHTLRKRSIDDFENEEGILSGGSAVRRAISCDSVNSDTSLGPLESPLPTITGQLCLSLRCFRINNTESLLAVNIIEARNLYGDSPDTYVAIFLSPDQKSGHFKTKVCRATNCPSYNETFIVDIGKTNRKLCFHIYNTKNDACSLIGETELSLQDAGSYKQPVTTWLTLTDTGQGIVEFGELMLSLSYLPTAERLTLILTKARRLPDPTNFNIFVKVYLQRNGKKVAKKRSSIKRSEMSPIFNEAFIFSLPPNLLSSVELHIILIYFPIGEEYSNNYQHQKIGNIKLCHNAQGKPGNHWNQMISSLRRPVSMWHTLRRPYITESSSSFLEIKEVAGRLKH